MRAPAPTRRKAQTADDLAASIAAPATDYYGILEIGENERRWSRLIDACWAERVKRGDVPASKARTTAENGFYDALPGPLRDQYRKIEEWNGHEANIYADAGFRIGLAVGRRGAR